MRYIIPFMILTAVSGCTQVNSIFAPNRAQGLTPIFKSVDVRPVARPVVAAPPRAVAPPPRVAKLTLPPAEKPQPVASSFGTTVASLGNVAEPGLWIKTPLVSERQKGKVTAANGTTVEMDLIPLPGPKTGGSRLSLAALQALGLPVTDLPEVVVAPL